MKSSRAAACYVSVFVGGGGVLSGCTAFSTRTFATRSTQQPNAFLLSALEKRTPRSLLKANHRQQRFPSTALHMNWLQNFFGGGAYNMGIDYDSLEFPGPELWQLAQDGKISSHSPSKPELELATFAGGCFWGLELAFQRVPGVEYTAAGYAQGLETCPTYDQVCAGNTGHTEAVCIYYNPKECSYETLLDLFFDRIDPTTVDGQGRDYGRQYRTGVYYHTDEQEALARARFDVEKSKQRRPIATECKQAKPFWPAENYHQQYLAQAGRVGVPQSAEKGCTDEIRCYG
jgi:peptide-methionine (S)-S-oxide reductase